MESKIADRIIEKLDAKTSPKGTHVKFNGEGYEAVNFSKENFKTINDFNGNCKIAFVDGGNNTIIESSDFCLQAARVYYTIYSKNKRIKNNKKDIFILAGKTNNKIDIEFFGAEEKNISFDLFDNTLAISSHQVSASSAANAARKIIEIKHAISAINSLEKGDIIVLDRDLQPSVTGEKEAIEELFLKAEQKGIIVCGIAKTSRLSTEEGGSVIESVKFIAPSEEWMYHPLGKIVDEKQNAEIMLVKLNKNSKYAFRFEIYKKNIGEIQKVLGLLKKNSSDPVFQGYPYGMIEADKFARLNNDEAEYMKMKLMTKAGKKSGKILDLMKSVDAHSILDNIS